MEMMSKGELKEFLSQPLIGRMATIKKDGSPHIAPIWFIYDGENVIVSTGKESQKVKNVRRDNRVAISIDTCEEGFENKGAIFEGNAELIEADVLETTKKIYVKYLGTIEHPMAKQLLDMPRVLIKLKPRKVISWDYSKM